MHCNDKIYLYLLSILLIASLGACSGASESGKRSTEALTGGPGEPPVPGEEVSAKSFSVSLTGVDIRRVSNGERIEVDTSAISSGVVQLIED